MSTEERYDIVIIGAGHNGTTAAAYLSKCGLSVCVLEEKSECGGGAEVVEVMPGVRLFPHAMLMYAQPAPGFEQLELWKYGFRMEHGAEGLNLGGLFSDRTKDGMGWGKITGMLGQPPFNRELMRATHWCPPHPPEIELTAETIPYMQVYKERAPDMWTDELLEMSMFDLMDEYCETEAFKVSRALGAWWSGAAGHWEGVGVPAVAGIHLLDMSMQSPNGVIPRGCMHGYYHAVFRCAITHGAVFRTCCPVDEIIITNGRAAGVRLRDDAACHEKVIWADKAVISGTEVRQTFLKLVGPRHLDAAFMQRIKDVSLKGGTLYVSHLFTREPLRPRLDGAAMGQNNTREIYYEHAADVDGYKTYPQMAPEKSPWFCVPSSMWLDASDQACQRSDGYLTGPFEMNVSIPEYHPEGPDALTKFKDWMNDYMIKAFSPSYENLNSDNLIYHWAGSPYEEEFRNSGMLGGTWCGTRHCRDQLWAQRPLPELARYRTPVDGLYHCHQTSGHPGGLCLMAIPYNLMHILIEDGVAQPGDWWYPSPWYIPEQGKKSAIPG